MYMKNSEKLNNSSAFSVNMRRVFVNKSFDKNEGFKKFAPDKIKKLVSGEEKTNDLLMVTSFQTGTAPIVQWVYYPKKKKQKINQIVSCFFKNLACSFRDFRDGILQYRRRFMILIAMTTSRKLWILLRRSLETLA
jgi:hypothetical protein